MATREGNWNAKFVWTDEAVEELHWIKDNMRMYIRGNLRQEEHTDKTYEKTETAAARKEVRLEQWDTVLTWDTYGETSVGPSRPTAEAVGNRRPLASPVSAPTGGASDASGCSDASYTAS
jgi:hypothetical protein